MNYPEKIDKIYRDKGLNAPFCEDLSIHLKTLGFKKVKGFSLYTNVFSRGNYPKEKIKLKYIYEYIKQYPSNANSETKTKTEPSALDVKI